MERSETVTSSEFLQFFTEHFSQDKDKFKKYRYSLIDYTAVTKVDVSSESIKRVAELSKEAAKVNPDPVIGFIANNDLVYGLTRMYTALVLRSKWEIEVFRDKDKALTWIRKRIKEKIGIDDLTFS